MSYLKLFKRSAKMIWKDKFLFIFGLFIAISSILNCINFKMNDPDKIDAAALKIKSFISIYPAKFFGILFFILIISVLLIIFKHIGDIGLIKCANDIDAGRDSANFSLGFKAGIQKFWKKLFFEIIIGMFVFCSMIVLVMPCIFLFVNNLIIPGVILSLLALIIFIPLVFVVSFIRIYGVRYLITENKGIVDSLKMGGNLFLANLKDSLMVALFMALFYLAVASVFVLGLLIFAIPFGIVGVILFIILGQIGKKIIVALFLSFVFIAVLFVSIFLKTFASVIWTLVFRQVK